MNETTDILTELALLDWRLERLKAKPPFVKEDYDEWGLGIARLEKHRTGLIANLEVANRHLVERLNDVAEGKHDDP